MTVVNFVCANKWFLEAGNLFVDECRCARARTDYAPNGLRCSVQLTHRRSKIKRFRLESSKRSRIGRSFWEASSESRWFSAVITASDSPCDRRSQLVIHKRNANGIKMDFRREPPGRVSLVEQRPRPSERALPSLIRIRNTCPLF